MRKNILNDYLTPTMAKRDESFRVEAFLHPDYKPLFEAIAKEKQWSNKKLAENIIIQYLEAHKKPKK